MQGTQYKWCAKYTAVLYTISMFECFIQYSIFNIQYSKFKAFSTKIFQEHADGESRIV